MNIQPFDSQLGVTKYIGSMAASVNYARKTGWVST